MMTLSEKLESSCILSQSRCKAKKYGIKDKKKRWFGVIVFVLMSLFTIWSKIINRGDKGTLTDDFLNYSIICIVLKMFFTFILKFMSKSVFSLNHNRIYRVFKFFGAVSSCLVFYFTMVAYINKSIGYWNEFALKYINDNNLTEKTLEANVDWIYNVVKIELNEDESFLSFIWNIFLSSEPINHKFTYALCTLSIITFVPTFIYLMISFLKGIIIMVAINYLLPIFLLVFCLPVIHIILWIKILFRPLPNFTYVYFDDNDKSYVIVEKRKVTGKYNKAVWFRKNFIRTLPITILVLSSATLYSLMIWTSYKYNLGVDLPQIMKQVNTDYSNVPLIPYITGIFC